MAVPEPPRCCLGDGPLQDAVVISRKAAAPPLSLHLCPSCKDRDLIISMRDRRGIARAYSTAIQHTHTHTEEETSVR